MILHIPHASTNTAGREFVCDLDAELHRMTDWYTDELFACDTAVRVQFPFSRLICDVERFEDDALEVMAQHGMGAVYTKNSCGETLRYVDEAERRHIIENFYRPHHAYLERATAAMLEKQGRALIIDCHSFPDDVLPHHLDTSVPRPDICIGTDAFHTSELLANVVVNYFKKQGYSVALNSPFAGTMVPMRYYQKEARVQSLMIELNRRLYMDGEGRRSEGFARLQQQLGGLLEWLAVAQLS